MIYFVVFIGLFSLRNFLEIIVKPRIKGNRLLGKKRGFISLLLLINSFFISGLVAAYFLFTTGPVNIFSYIIGVLLLCAGFGGRVLSLKEIGKNYSQYIDCVPNGCLITTGAYSRIRHPLYFFYIIEMIGFLFIRYNYISLIALCVVVAAVSCRIKAEEDMLSERYKDVFYAYKERTKCLMPFIL